MPNPDEIVHQSTRLKLMAALTAASGDGFLEFSRLKVISGATDGNLGAHLATLESAGYVEIVKDLVGKRGRTRVRATRVGRNSLEEHVSYLRSVIDGL